MYISRRKKLFRRIQFTGSTWLELKWDFLDLDIFKQGMLTPKFPEEGRPPKFPEEDYVRRVMVAFELRQENKRKARTRRYRAHKILLL